MMYTDKIVAVVKVGGKVLREQHGSVTLPFGSEYSILIKNLNSVRAQVKVSVDGTDATDGTHLVIPANGEVELERFIRNGNLRSGNKLKFIERTAGIESHRGIKVDDGLIRVEAWKEYIHPVIDVPVVRHHYYDHYHYHYPWHYPIYPKSWPHQPYIWGGLSSSVNTSTTLGGHSVGSASFNTMSANSARSASGSLGSGKSSSPLRTAGLRFMDVEASECDAGITVAGGESNQQFNSVAGFSLESISTVIVLRLRGKVGKIAVAKAVTVKAKKKCDTCGKSNKANGQFCSGCGTALVLA